MARRWKHSVIACVLAVVVAGGCSLLTETDGLVASGVATDAAPSSEAASSVDAGGPDADATASTKFPAIVGTRTTRGVANQDGGITIPFPAGTAADDVVVAFYDGYAGIIDYGAGWEALGSARPSNAFGGNTEYAAVAHSVTASEDENSVGTVFSVAGFDYEFAIATVRGARRSQPFSPVVFETTACPDGGALTVTLPSLKTRGPSRVLYFVGTGGDTIFAPVQTLELLEVMPALALYQRPQGVSTDSDLEGAVVQLAMKDPCVSAARAALAIVAAE